MSYHDMSKVHPLSNGANIWKSELETFTNLDTRMYFNDEDE